jgi:hypothetical protein
MDRSGVYAGQTKEKTEILRKSLVDKEFKECTFTPQVNCSGSSRTLDEFLVDQQRFLNRKKNSSSIESKVKRVPTINSNSAAMVDKRPKNVYNRLYMLHKKPLVIEEDREVRVKANRERRELKLYALAKKKEVQTPNKEQKPVQSKEPSIDPLVIQGFNREFNKAIERIEVMKDTKVDYQGLIRVLTIMHFIDESFEDLSSRNGTRGLTARLWSSIKLPAQDLTPISTLQAYLAAILNIKLDGSLLSAKEVKKIAQNFEVLYLTRKSKGQKKKEKVEDFSFRPELCEESRRLLGKSLERPETTCNRLAELADAMMAKKKAQIEYSFSNFL